MSRRFNLASSGSLDKYGLKRLLSSMKNRKMEKTQTGTLIWANGQLIKCPPGHAQRMVWRNGEIVSELVNLETGEVVHGNYSNEPPTPNRIPGSWKGPGLSIKSEITVCLEWKGQEEQ